MQASSNQESKRLYYKTLEELDAYQPSPFHIPNRGKGKSYCAQRREAKARRKQK